MNCIISIESDPEQWDQIQVQLQDNINFDCAMQDNSQMKTESIQTRENHFFLVCPPRF